MLEHQAHWLDNLQEFLPIYDEKCSRRIMSFDPPHFTKHFKVAVFMVLNCCGGHTGPHAERGISWLFSEQRLLAQTISAARYQMTKRSGPSSAAADRSLDGRLDSAHFSQCMQRLSCSIGGSR
ncbi:hypothetical protein T10_9658 [Trichinella papuae]|uniref:Uncharacterized protein n=1 Tax=Trichinella papuae TaxID=268474 RepID=A0A0V1M0K2_9BILA|nr:hypothetical protein T10_9658 [Trichinella papuae]